MYVLYKFRGGVAESGHHLERLTKRSQVPSKHANNASESGLAFDKLEGAIAAGSHIYSLRKRAVAAGASTGQANFLPQECSFFRYFSVFELEDPSTTST